MSDQPGKHGHQHLPDGPDPIPAITTPGGSSAIEWCVVKGAQGWEDDRTTQECSIVKGLYDTDTPTFDIDDGNLIIQKGGAYTMDTWAYNLFVTDQTLFYNVELSIARVAGPTIAGWDHSWATNVFFQVEKFYWVANEPTGPNALFPMFHEFVNVGMDADFTPPLEFELKAVYIEDGSFVAAANGQVQMLVVRLGDAFAE